MYKFKGQTCDTTFTREQLIAQGYSPEVIDDTEHFTLVGAVKLDQGKIRMDLIPLEIYEMFEQNYDDCHEYSALITLNQWARKDLTIDLRLALRQLSYASSSTNFLYGIGSVLTFGAGKYTANNWLNGMAWSRLIGAANRHILSHLDGEELDPESGLPHLHHAACCITFLLTYEARGLGEDDRV